MQNICFLLSLLHVVSRTSDFVGSLSVFLVELAATLVLTEVSLPAQFYFHRASSLSPPNNENPYSYKKNVGYARQAIFHSSPRCLEKSAVSELPTFARQDVLQYPDRSNIVPSANSQFPISKIPLMKQFMPRRCCGPAITKLNLVSLIHIKI